MLRKALTIISEKFIQAWSACMICMVQGDLSVISWSHALTASKTGILTGLSFWLTTLGDGQPKGRWYPAWVTGVLTMVSDIVVHPTHFGDQWVEAACTGLGAAVLCFIWERNNASHDY